MTWLASIVVSVWIGTLFACAGHTIHRLRTDLASANATNLAIRGERDAAVVLAHRAQQREQHWKTVHDGLTTQFMALGDKCEGYRRRFEAELAGRRAAEADVADLRARLARPKGRVG